MADAVQLGRELMPIQVAPRADYRERRLQGFVRPGWRTGAPVLGEVARDLAAVLVDEHTDERLVRSEGKGIDAAFVLHNCLPFSVILPRMATDAVATTIASFGSWTARGCGDELGREVMPREFST